MTLLEKKLKDENLRITNARRVIFNILLNSDRAMSPQDICAKLDESLQVATDQASVYRNLLLFSEIGLTHRLESGKYSLCQHGSHQHSHIHIVASCVKCGKTSELQKHDKGVCQLANQFTAVIDGFDSFSGITLNGRCESCLQNI